MQGAEKKVVTVKAPKFYYHRDVKISCVYSQVLERERRPGHSQINTLRKSKREYVAIRPTHLCINDKVSFFLNYKLNDFLKQKNTYDFYGTHFLLFTKSQKVGFTLTY